MSAPHRKHRILLTVTVILEEPLILGADGRALAFVQMSARDAMEAAGALRVAGQIIREHLQQTVGQD